MEDVILSDDVEAIKEKKGQRKFYEQETRKLKDPALTLADLEDKDLWETHETFKKFSADEFANQSQQERARDAEEQILAMEFREARKQEIARRRLSNMVDDVINAPDTLEEKMAKLTPEKHRQLFETLMRKSKN